MSILNVQLPKEKEYLNKAVDAFNKLCEQGLYPDIISYTYYELYQKCPEIPATLWKEFLLDPTITAWFASERTLLLRAQVNSLIKSAGTSKSTASAQVLSTLMKQLNETEAQDNNQTMIVYTFVPLTEEELKSDNARTNQLPNSIRDAVQIIKRASIFEDDEE